MYDNTWCNLHLYPRTEGSLGTIPLSAQKRDPLHCTVLSMSVNKRCLRPLNPPSFSMDSAYHLSSVPFPLPRSFHSALWNSRQTIKEISHGLKLSFRNCFHFLTPRETSLPTRHSYFSYLRKSETFWIPFPTSAIVLFF